MKARVLVLSALLGSALYASQWAVRALSDLARMPVIERFWLLPLSAIALAFAAAWLVGRLRGLVGLRLAVASWIALLAVLAVWVPTVWAISVLPAMPALYTSREVMIALMYLVFAVEAVGASWLVMGLTLRVGAHRTSASTRLGA